MMRPQQLSLWLLLLIESLPRAASSLHESHNPITRQSKALRSNRQRRRAATFDIIKEEDEENRSKSGDAQTSVQQALEQPPPDTTTTYEENNEFLGIPGTTQTINGYDTALGDDSICWKGHAAELNETDTVMTDAVDELVKTVFPNPLVEDFTLLGKTEILNRCPEGNTVKVQKPLESLRGERLRTLQYYNYTLHVEIDLDTLAGDYIVTDDGTASIALQVVVCSLGKSGFCSPFVHEQANAREAIDQANSGEEIVTQKKKVKGNLHGGTHIHSPWVFLDLGANRTIQANVTVPMIVNHPGDYFVIGTVQLYTGINGSNAYRWDIANALESGDGRYLLYQDPPQINVVSDGVLYFSYVAIAVAGSVIIFLIAQTIKHRDHQVLQLSQGDFLLVFLFSALVSTVATFLLEPKNDVYCRISYPIILIPIQLMYAITVGRLWRIHAVISPLLLEHLNKGRPGLIQRFVQSITYISFKLNDLFVCQKKHMRRSSGSASSVKQQISRFQLALVVSMFTLPQAVLQLVAFLVQPQEIQIEFNEDESVGRQTCGSGASTAQNLVIYGFFLLVLLVIILLVMAHSSRKLPSLFNETSVIYDSTFLSMVLLLLGGAVIALTNGPGTSPDVEYLVSLVLILSITLNSAVRIMVPKLKMVWRNETVIVSKLVTDHHRKQREKDVSRSGRSVHVSGLDMSNQNRYDQSFSNTAGDYDRNQTDKLLTIHSCSNDIRGRSSISNISDGPQSSSPFEISPSNEVNDLSDSFSFSHDKPGPVTEKPKHDGRLTSIEESPPKADFASQKSQRRMGIHSSAHGESIDQTTSSTELDVESGDSRYTPGDSSPNNTTMMDGSSKGDHSIVEAHPGVTPKKDNGGGESDLELDLEAAEDEGGTDKEADKDSKKSNSFEVRASGFLKSALKKGKSLRHTTSDRSLGGSLHSDKDQGLDKSDRSDKKEAKKHKRPVGRSKTPPKKALQKTIVVTEDETPARRLVLKMLDLQDQLEAVNNKIMSGLAVSPEDWKVITKLTSKLDNTFTEEVEFEWEIERRAEETLKEVLPRDMSGRSWDTAGGVTPKKRASDDSGTLKNDESSSFHTELHEPQPLQKSTDKPPTFQTPLDQSPTLSRPSSGASNVSQFNDEDDGKNFM